MLTDVNGVRLLCIVAGCLTLIAIVWVCRKVSILKSTDGHNSETKLKRELLGSIYNPQKIEDDWYHVNTRR